MAWKELRQKISDLSERKRRDASASDKDKTNMNQTTIDAGRFDVAKIAAILPETATTLLVDHYLTNREAASARVFRVYKPTPPHYHTTCDEYLYVFSGRGTFWLEDESTSAEFAPGSCSFSSAERCTRCRRSWQNRSSSSQSTRRAAIQRTSSLSIRRTAHPKASLRQISNICSGDP
jgi:mannose-6-phosphate isomerase-like protein (cupin superfamily)